MAELDAEPPVSRSRRIRKEAALLAFFFLLAAAHTGLPAGLATRLYPGPDPSQDVWVLDWVSRHLLSSPHRIFAGNQFFPSPWSVLFCDPLLLPAALVTPLRLAWDNPVFLYNSAILITLTLAGYGFCLLGRRLWGSLWPGLLAGAVVPYHAVFLAHVQHLNLLTVTGYPFVLLGMLRLLERPSLGVAVATGAVLGLQASTSGYHALSLALLSLIVTVWAGPSLWRRRTSLCWLTLALTAAVVVAPHVVGFIALRSETPMSRDLTSAANYSLDLPLFLVTSETFVWRGALSGGVPYRSLFPGLVPIVLALAGLSGRWERTLKLLGTIALVFFVLALGPDLQVHDRPRMPLPYRFLFRHVPFFDSIRHPVTFMGPVVMALGLVAARGLRQLRLHRRPLVAAPVVALALVETLMPWPDREERSLEMPAAYRLLEDLAPGALVEVPFDDGRGQWWAMFHRRSTTAGQGAFQPERYANLRRFVRTEWSVAPGHDLEGRRSLLYLKARFPARYLLLHPDAPVRLRANVDATGAFRLLREGSDGSRVYGIDHGGDGAVIRRVLTERQLRGGLSLRVEAHRGAVLWGTLNGQLGIQRPMAAAVEEFVWRVPRRLVPSGLSEITLQLASGRPFRLTRFDWQE